MGPIWGRQDPGGPHVGPMNFAIWDVTVSLFHFLFQHLPVYIQGTKTEVIIVPAEVLAPGSAKPSADAVLNISISKFLSN